MGISLTDTCVCSDGLRTHAYMHMCTSGQLPIARACRRTRDIDQLLQQSNMNYNHHCLQAEACGHLAASMSSKVTKFYSIQLLQQEHGNQTPPVYEHSCFNTCVLSSTRQPAHPWAGLDSQPSPNDTPQKRQLQHYIQNTAQNWVSRGTLKESRQADFIADCTEQDLFCQGWVYNHQTALASVQSCLTTRLVLLGQPPAILREGSTSHCLF